MFEYTPPVLPRVTFGFVNCNRLHYLKSCVESLLECTKDYPNKEIIIVDNASVEEGTEEYLLEKENAGFKVVRQSERDPINEFAKALNIITKEATGEFICPLQGDMQFVLSSGWLKEYVLLYGRNIETIGCIIFDAQRTVRISQHQFSDVVTSPGGYNFAIDFTRPPLSGAANVMYHKSVLGKIYPWCVKNANHEGGSDSETEMLNRVKSLKSSGDVQWSTIVPIIPPSVAIYTDMRGTMARVRGNKRYGDYWAPKEDFRYYQIHEFDELITMYKDREIPIGIEKMAVPIGGVNPLDSEGNWLKNPINPETASSSDYTVIYEEEVSNQLIDQSTLVKKEYLDDWLNS